MKPRFSKAHLSVLASAALVCACGPSDEGGEPATGAGSPVEQSVAAIGTPYVGISDEELGWRADVPETSTASLIVEDGFNFEAARRTTINLSVPQAVNQSAEATICTDYQFNGVDYDVNYDSCILQATLVRGELQEEITLANQHSSVLGIVWLSDAEAVPVYQEFQLE